MKRRFVHILLFAMFILGMSSNLYAQVSYNPAFSGNLHRVSIGIEALYYYGDVCPVLNHPLNIPPRKENISGALLFSHTYHALPTLGLRSSLGTGLLRGESMNESYDYWIGKGKRPKSGNPGETYDIGSFNSIFGELSFGVEWYPIVDIDGGFYIYGGVGAYFGATHCGFFNTARNPGNSTDPTGEGWRFSLAPMAIAELGYSFQLDYGHSLSLKASIHQSLVNVNCKNKKVGYNIDGWGRGDANSADYSYEDVGNISLDAAGKSIFGQWTDGYFTLGLVYSFNVGDCTRKRTYITKRPSKNEGEYSPRVSKRNVYHTVYKNRSAQYRNGTIMNVSRYKKNK